MGPSQRRARLRNKTRRRRATTEEEEGTARAAGPNQDAETTQDEAEAEDAMQTLKEVPSAVGATEGTGANSAPKPGESR